MENPRFLPDERFDRLTRLAQRLLGAPIAFIALVDDESESFRSSAGLSLRQTPRASSFSAHAILGPDILAVADASLDARFQENPMVRGEPGIRFCAAYPLNGPGGTRIGALCVADAKPRVLSHDEARALADLGRLVEAELAAAARPERDPSALRLKAVLDSAAELAVMTSDENGTITAFSAGAEKMLGYEAKDMVGASSLATLHLPAELEAATRALDESGAGLRGFEVLADPPRRAGRDVREWTYVRKDGRLVSVLLALTALRDESGRILGYVAVADDVSARRQMQAEIARARDASLSAAKAKSEFLANMSHEIRTPLNGIIGMTELLLDSGLDEAQREFAEAVRGSGETLLEIVNDILDYSSLESGKLAFERSVFNLRELIGEISSGFEAAARRKNIEFIGSVDAGAPTRLIGDPARLRQVLSQLLSNAVKFTEKGNVAIRVIVIGKSAENALLRFEVLDSGIGIARDVLPKLFKRFSKADASTTRRYGGTGLGLSIANRIVSLMKGRIEASSLVGAGSVFRFDLDFAIPREAAAAAPAEARPLILVAEDNLVNQTLLVKMLAKLGCDADVAEDGSKVLQAFPKRAYAAVLMDCDMPVMDGYTATRELRRIGVKVPIVAVTAHALEGARQAALEAGMDDYLAKPYKQADLAHILRRWVPITKTSAPALNYAPVAEPVLAPRADVAPREAAVEVGRPAAGARGGVLFVEYGPEIVVVVERLLAKAGIGAVICDSGAAALAALETVLPDLLLLDVNLPDMDGFELCRKIRENPKCSPLPVVFLTGHRDLKSRLEGFNAGGVDFVTKPFNPEGLATRLRTHLTLKNERDSLTARVDEFMMRERVRRELLDMFSDVLRTPPSALRQTLDILRDSEGVKDRECVRFLESSDEAADLALMFANDMLDVTVGVTRARSVEVDFARLVQRLRDLLKAQLSKSEQTLDVRLEGVGPGLCTDELLLLRVILNLVSNASKFGPAGAAIDLSFERIGARLRVAVRDRGLGVNADVNEHGPLPGRGVGLAFCAKAAGALGGRIWVEDAPGGGSVFLLDIPLRDPYDPSDDLIDEEMRRRFLVATSEQLKSASAMLKISGAVLSDVDLLALRRIVHHLAGSLGMYGYESAGKIAGRYEFDLKAGTTPAKAKEFLSEVLRTIIGVGA